MFGEGRAAPSQHYQGLSTKICGEQVGSSFGPCAIEMNNMFGQSDGFLMPFLIDPYRSKDQLKPGPGPH